MLSPPGLRNGRRDGPGELPGPIAAGGIAARSETLHAECKTPSHVSDRRAGERASLSVDNGDA